tara:strand:+ start:12860 stop:13879 length:1020 start_codon:yes stop_codon:yes gene_type:complete
MENQYNKYLTTTPITELLDSAFSIRERHFGKQVTIHIINNAQNGHCPEDCSYCAQAKTADSNIETYGLKPADEMLEEATRAYEQGAHRYCMVLSGRGPTPTKINQITDVIRTIKRKHPDKEVCLSAGLINDGMAIALQQAGLDRLNHNINTSEDKYADICTTHTYMDRLNTLTSAQKAGLTLCSGIIVGMGETHDELIAMALKLKSLNVRSIPINFLIPVPGTPFENCNTLTPEFCLRVLCLFRLINTDAEIRMAAGREYHLRSLQVMGLYPANSLFMDGYLNTVGTHQFETLKMIQDAGFDIESNTSVDALLAGIKAETHDPSVQLKTKEALRPVQTN